MNYFVKKSVKGRSKNIGLNRNIISFKLKLKILFF